jgi:hypothetical protein
MTEGKNFINLVHGCDNTRVYKMDNDLFCFTAGLTEIIPFKTKTLAKMVKYLLEKISNEQCQVEIMFGYAQGSLSKNRKKKLNKLLRHGQGDVNYKNLSVWISLLI